MNAPLSMPISGATEIEADPIEIDPPTCEQCGCVIEDLEALIYLCAADLVTQWERADPRDAWRHTGKQPPRVVDQVPDAARPHRTPQATIDAFKYVVHLDDPEYLARWLAQRPLDAPALIKLWESKHVVA
jgi:hypothetical protein